MWSDRRGRRGAVNSGESVLRWEAIREARLLSTPFRWAVVRDVLASPDTMAELCRTFPTSGFRTWQRGGGPKRYLLASRPMLPIGADPAELAADLGPGWRAFAGAVASREYREALSSLTRLDLRGLPIETTFWRYEPSYFLGPHADEALKVVSQIFYFNERWQAEWGGCLRILRSSDEDDVSAELLPTVSASPVIVRSDDSWHAVAPVTKGQATRRSVQVVVYRQDHEWQATRRS